MATATAANIVSAAFPELSTTRPIANVATAPLIEIILGRGEAHLSARGAVAARTGKFTGRTPPNRFIVKDALTADRVAWGKSNQAISAESFEKVRRRMAAYLNGREVFVQDCFAGGDPAYRLKVRVVTELAWHSLFVHQLFIRPSAEDLQGFTPDFTIVSMPGCEAVPAEDGTASGTYILVNFERRLILIGGTYYAGEMKKSIFSVLNFLLPERGVMPMHCSANVGPDGDSALFFGLSGTGKTTLSADANRRLIGDDEHGWGANGVFNFEGGCYAKCIHLSETGEPEIWNAVRFGTVLENVKLDPATGVPDFEFEGWTENTRAAYPIEYIDNAVLSARGPHPKNVVLLTADAFGVMPPIARLSVPQTMYHFLSGYTAKLAGTEAGVTEPKATFSTCFGEPFMPLSPMVYAKMLGERVTQHGARCWLINTGWTGGAYGVGTRMKLSHTRTMVRAALSGALDKAKYNTDPIFGLEVPAEVPGVPTEVLNPRNTWKDAAAYEKAARHLAGLFRSNFERFSDASAEIAAAGPR
ncbi:MAG TPA: phosphoenolpyruvate carboxykinase (ATP) [Terriglobales bacterium]|nr:phosphoenolpyruvate carboxykinase (ATP) [Terriglobales bacterium]